MGLASAVALVAVLFGSGLASAAPGTTTPSTSGTPSGTTTPSTSGATSTSAAPGGVTGVPVLDNLLNSLAGQGQGGAASPAAGQTKQMIVVTAPKASDPTATLTAFERGTDNSWKPVIGPTKAFLGSLGQGEPKDNVYRTPQGTFPLDQAFGRLANPGTKLPYIKVDQQDWWDSNTKSPTYNTHVRQAASPGGDSENLYNSGPVYDYAVNIAHNPQRIPGKASAMFLHVTNGQPTMGCVAIDKELMRKILVWLDPAKSPKITIGVNQSAPPADTPSATPALPGGDLVNQILKQFIDLVPSLLGTATGAGSAESVPVP
ncbi:hypothetical protein GS4_35_00510 [Gordonia soli NBRC 108243]|uniref:L,D-TPase catalytic domain-containing protein n=1 Tax=Gordonia soli NBRC 108243 TaxID=1223545 RepID=M0QP89_9ACTN|nr:hypothetical protein GS4_35_00510 [Gordonia soli NBRC 108243]